MTAFPRTGQPTSLLTQLLKALAAPLFALVLVSGIAAYWLSAHYTNEVFDRALYDTANNLAQQLRLEENRSEKELADLSQRLLSNEDNAVVFWQLKGPQGIIAGQDVWLGYGSGNTTYRDAQLYYAWYNGHQVRAVHLNVKVKNPQTQEELTYAIEVAERLTRRELAARQILLAVSLPLFFLLGLGAIIISVILRQELNPLKKLTNTLNQQTAKSLEDLDDHLVPAEIQPLTQAMNDLLARLREALDAQRKFIADAAHQLRTPLTALKLHADRAAQSNDITQLKNAVQELQTSANRAVRLSNQLLSLARAEPGVQTADFSTIDVRRLVFDLGAEWVPQAIEKKIDLGFVDIPENAGNTSPITIQGNLVLLREALSNLIDNALKYLPSDDLAAHGQITLYVDTEQSSSQPMARILVEDNGYGIPAEKREEVFQRFFRADHQGVGGSGLGLAIVRDIVTLHGGTIKIEDRPVPLEKNSMHRPGMRFVMRFPLV